MKKIIICLGSVFFIATSSFSQCPVDPFIESDYDIDTQLLALREILSDPTDPDYDNPFVPQARVTPYIEKLSAIFENPNNDPAIDSLFNEFQIHANYTYNVFTEYRSLIFSVNTNVSWVQTLKDTGVSGFAPLDNFFATYQLTVTDFIDLVSQGVTQFTMTTGFDFLNIFAILDDLEAIQDINSAALATGAYDLNYSGIPYFLNGDPVEVCDIVEDNNVYTFCLYAGDCLAGCLYSKCWTIEVAEDCTTVIVLDAPVTTLDTFTVYPNPALDIIQLKGVTSEIKTILIHSVGGRMIPVGFNNSESMDISHLNTGIYFLEIITSEGNRQVQKFIKQ